MDVYSSPSRGSQVVYIDDGVDLEILNSHICYPLMHATIYATRSTGDCPKSTLIGPTPHNLNLQALILCNISPPLLSPCLRFLASTPLPLFVSFSIVCCSPTSPTIAWTDHVGWWGGRATASSTTSRGGRHEQLQLRRLALSASTSAATREWEGGGRTAAWLLAGCPGPTAARRCSSWCVCVKRAKEQESERHRERVACVMTGHTEYSFVRQILAQPPCTH